MRKQIIILVLLVFVTSIFSCRGDNGIDGKDGKDGVNGQAGANGNANVIVGDWFTPNAYTMQTVYGIRTFSYVLNDSKLTKEVLDKGTVLVYGNLRGYVTDIWPTDQVSLLPISLTYIYLDVTMTDTWSVNLSPSKLKIQAVNDKNNYSSFTPLNRFRYIIIPAGTGNKNANQIDYNDYESVKKFYNLKD